MGRTNCIPQLVSIPAAAKMYAEKASLRNADIRELFGCGQTTANRLKNMVDELRRERGLPMIHPRYVDTALAFEAWGIDIDKLMRRYRDAMRFIE